MPRQGRGAPVPAGRRLRAAVDGRRAGFPRRVRPGCRRAGPPVRRHRHRRGRRPTHWSPLSSAGHATAYLPNPAGWLTGSPATRRSTGCGVRTFATRSTPRPPRRPPTPTPSQPAQSRTTGSDSTSPLHPALAPENRIALTLRLLGGLTVAEIAHAFLVPETTMAQRITRAKVKIKQARIPTATRPTTSLRGCRRFWRCST